MEDSRYIKDEGGDLILKDPMKDPKGKKLRHVPFVLAGPIVRRVDVENNSASVWLAFSEKPGALKVRVRNKRGGSGGWKESNSQSPIKLGPHLWVALVAISGSHLEEENGQFDLQPGNTYVYDIHVSPPGAVENGWIFDSDNSEDYLNGNLVEEDEDLDPYEPDLTYKDEKCPSFPTPPSNLSDLRLIHTSCRKPHGESMDVLPAVNLMIKDYMRENGEEKQRPHQLFLTGDQIYADDVADPLMKLIVDGAAAMFNKDGEENKNKETFGEVTLDGKAHDQMDLRPGHRQDLITRDGPYGAGMSSGHAKSHLISFAEYCLHYITSWSEALWPGEEYLPKYGNLKLEQSEEAYEEEKSKLSNFYMTMDRVRRAMAHVPVYMQFDDHDVTDDWYLNREWVKSVVGEKGTETLGERIISNALLAYSIFQAAGNEPQRWKSDSPEASILQAVDGADINKLNPDSNSDSNSVSRTDIQKKLDIPYLEDGTLKFPRKDSSTRRVRWDYTVESPSHTAKVLDTRTMRGFPGPTGIFGGALGGIHAPKLLADDAWEIQLKGEEWPTGHFPEKLPFVISPVPVFTHPAFEDVKHFGAEFSDIPFVGGMVDVVKGGSGFQLPEEVSDLEGWNASPAVTQKLLGRLSRLMDHVAILSGDVHFGMSARTQYWALAPSDPVASGGPSLCNIMNFTASAAKNEIKSTREIGSQGYKKRYEFGIGPRKSDDILDSEGEDIPYRFAFAGWQGSDVYWFPEVDTGSEEISLAQLQIPGDVPIVSPFYNFVTDLNDQEDLRETLKRSDPDWIYRVDYLESDASKGTTPTDRLIAAFMFLDDLSGFFSKDWHAKDLFWDGVHRGVVGHNNMGEIRFTKDENEIEQRLWFWLDLMEGDSEVNGNGLSEVSDPNAQVPPQNQFTFLRYRDKFGPVPMTQFSVPLDMKDDPSFYGGNRSKYISD